MRKLIFLALSSIFVSWGAQAASGIQGSWAGWGLWTFGTSGTNCQMKIQFSESETEFKRLGGTFDCNVVALYSDPLTWTKQGDQLFLEGSRAGEIKAGMVKFSEAANERTQVTTTINIAGDQADYEEIWYEDGTKVLYRITGQLRRSPP